MSGLLTSFRPIGIATLLTDFGLSDTYVGQMKGVLLSIEPTLRIVDLTHEVSPQDIAEGAFHLSAAIGTFPPGTVHVSVVDPGVGTERRAIVVEAGDAMYVTPDNGILTPVLGAAKRAFEITNARLMRPTPTSTFHGRDIFAPIAGYLAAGQISMPEVGHAISLESLVRLSELVDVPGSRPDTSIVSIDRFGNCITMIDAGSLPDPGTQVEIVCGRFRVRSISLTYGDVEPGEPLALIGSYGTLELSVRNGSAAREFGLVRGDMVSIKRE